MSLLSALEMLFPAILARKPVIAAVGGGGKTGTLFSLAAALAAAGSDVILTTTTHIRDPRHESGRNFDTVVVDKSLASPQPGQPDVSGPVPQSGHELETRTETRSPNPARSRVGTIRVLASALEQGDFGPRLIGIHPDRAVELLGMGDAVLVEADGSRMLPVKAPAPHEPAMPPGTDLVLGLIGLDCLGKPMDEATVHRPELFTELTGCEPGQAITASTLRCLAGAPLGLFKDTPVGSKRLLVLNKVDTLDPAVLAGVASCFGSGSIPGLDAVLLYSARSDTASVLIRCLSAVDVRRI
jgi:probable selenium-dependent hydroxylase accessory protein YqeC